MKKPDIGTTRVEDAAQSQDKANMDPTPNAGESEQTSGTVMHEPVSDNETGAPRT